MSSARQIVPVIFDQQVSARRVVVGTTLKAPDANQGITLYYGTQVVFQATIYNGAVTTAFAPVQPCTWLFGIDDVPFSDTADYVLSEDDQFNIAADWADLNEANGKICWRADLASEPLKTALNLVTATTKLMYGNLWMLSGEGNVLIGSWPITVGKVYVDPSTAKPVTGITHLTTDAAAATYVPIWGDQARWKWSGTGWKYLFSDNYWREFTPTLVDGNPVIAWGNPEANS